MNMEQLMEQLKQRLSTETDLDKIVEIYKTSTGKPEKEQLANKDFRWLFLNVERFRETVEKKFLETIASMPLTNEDLVAIWKYIPADSPIRKKVVEVLFSMPLSIEASKV